MVSDSAIYPIVLTHLDVVAVRNGQKRLASILPQIAILLVARGANRIVIPAPDDKEKERVYSGLTGLPAERRALVEIVDESGDLVRQVHDYLTPLARQAKKWPEDAFVSFASNFLYELSLGLKHKAGVLSTSASVMRDFVPIVDPAVFDGEARFRLAELFRMICAFEPSAVDHGVFQTDIPHGDTMNALSIMEDARFQELVIASGRIGYLKHPLLGLQRLKRRFTNLISRPVVKGTMALASTAVDAAGGAGLGAATMKAVGFATPDSKHSFNPPFISLGPTKLSLYGAVLREQLPGFNPPPGSIMVFQSRTGHSWLSVGEEGKLMREAAAGLAPRIGKYRQALSALHNLV